MLGAFFAVLSAATFGFNTALARRGMITASALQGMIITVPIGVPLVFVLERLAEHIEIAGSLGLGEFSDEKIDRRVFRLA